jgi:NAD(P)H-flavin reductase
VSTQVCTTDDGRRTLAPPERRHLPIVERREHGAYVVLRCVDAGGPPPRPGQFAMLAAAERWGGGDGERPFLPRAFSVMRVPRAGELEFLLEVVGPGTERLCELDAGDGLWLLGPLGIGFSSCPADRRPLLVGGGVGIAPLAILQDELGVEAAPALLGFRDAAHAVGAELLADTHVATDDGSVGHHGRVTDLLVEELERTDADAIQVYACGPPPMLEAVRALCADRGVAAELALESGMACGFGACFGCVVPTRTGYVRLCVDGPVLDATDLESALTPGAGH